MQKQLSSIKRAADRQATAVKSCSSRSFPRHTHEDYGIGVMITGAQRSWSGRGTVEACAGDVITVNPGEVHDGTPIGGSRTWAMLYLSPEKIAAITSDICADGRADIEFADPVLRDRRAARRFVAAYGAFSNDETDPSDETLISLVAGLLKATPMSHVATLPSTVQTRNRIDDDPSGYHSLDELAREAGTSKFQTLRSFARLTGMTPHAYVIQRRLDLARSMIRTGIALADAASGAGFADQSHFHRNFIRRYGLTPGAYATAMR